ncbi:MAG: ATP-binding protein [Candidatus Eremiobacteraeota bacterium]|nr:ATP-binding protein [Candidatus Eremiobacteraeota bacterium]
MRVSSEAPCTPLEFSVDLELPNELPLDVVVCTFRQVAHYGRVFFYGIVDWLDMQHGYRVKVRITRIEPEIFVAPEPGAEVERANPVVQAIALHFDSMKRKMVAGVLGTGQPAYFNVDFLSGERGGHVNIGGISGVATKTSYALFLLYSLFHSSAAQDSRAVLFNVKGDDLLYLHKPNIKLSAGQRTRYEHLDLPVEPFADVAYHGIESPLWTLKEFAEREFIRYLFSEPDQSGTLEFAVDRLAEILKEAAAESEGPDLRISRKIVHSYTELAKIICSTVADKESMWFENVAASTKLAVVRRLKGIAPQVESLIGPGAGFNYDHQLNVIDLHRLTDKAKSFVIGAVLRTLYEGRESQQGEHPTVYLVLDELNKYAPRDSKGPIGQMLLDVAERGRSLGIILIGAQQTASEVEDRVVGNAALRIVGRLEACEARKDTYGWLGSSLNQRATLIQPGNMIISQPQVPVPLLIRFPFPAWATRRSEASESPSFGLHH